MIEGKFQAHNWEEIYAEIRFRCGEWGILHTTRRLAWRDSFRHRRLIYNVEFVAYKELIWESRESTKIFLRP